MSAKFNIDLGSIFACVICDRYIVGRFCGVPSFVTSMPFGEVTKILTLHGVQHNQGDNLFLPAHKELS